MALYLTLLALAALAPVALSACGGGSGSTESSSATTNANGSATNAKEETTDSGAAIRDFGHEATGPQAQQPEAVVLDYLDARAAGEWSRACSKLTESDRRVFATVAATRLHTGQKPGCAAAMEHFTQRLSRSERAGLADAEIEVVRIGGGQGYAIYALPSGAEYAMRLQTEVGEWKIAGISIGVPLNR